MNRLFNRPIYFDGDDGSGSGDAGTGDAGGQAGGEAGQQTGAGDKTFTQADLNTAAGTARSEGRAAAERKIAEDLGVDLGKAKEIIQRALDQEESEKSEAQKAIEKAAADSKKADEREASASLREHTANVREALRDEGVPKDRIGAVQRLVDVEVGADEAAIKAAVEATKKDFPELFGEAGRGGAPSSDTGGAPAGSAGAGGEDAMERGRKKFAAEGATSDDYPMLKEALNK